MAVSTAVCPSNAESGVFTRSLTKKHCQIPPPVYCQSTALTKVAIMSHKNKPQLGILGGLSWHSSAQYYTLINRGVEKALGYNHNPQILLHSLNFKDIAQLFKQKEAATKRIVEECQRLQEFGCDAILIASNTVHFCYDAVMAQTDIPTLHIADAVGTSLTHHGHTTVALLGTRYTMNLGFYKNRLQQKQGIEVITPDSSTKHYIDKVIYNELVKGHVSPDSQSTFIKILEALKSQGATAFIAGCTEIPLLFQNMEEALPLPMIDSTALHCQAAINWYLEQIEP